MLLRYAIGSALRRIRLDRELTLRTVADTARISMPYLSEIERGRKEPSSEILEVICRALGLTLVDLLAEATDEVLVVDLAEERSERIAVVSSLGGADADIRCRRSWPHEHDQEPVHHPARLRPAAAPRPRARATGRRRSNCSSTWSTSSRSRR